MASLARGAGFDPAGRRCLVLGAGGAARAVVLALAEGGASRRGGPEPDARAGRAAAADLAGPAGLGRVA